MNFSSMPIVISWFRILVLMYTFAPTGVQAAHPLITEDTGTQGQGNSQIEFTHEHSTLRQGASNQYLSLTSAVFSYGIMDSTDVILSLPYLRIGNSSSGAAASGVGDVGLDVKWRFYESGHLSLALKPGVTFASGDETRGLGTGKQGWGVFLATSYELSSWALHLHLGSFQNHNALNERVHLWHASAAVSHQLGDTLKLIVDAGIDTHTDRSAKSDPVFLIGGLIWALHKSFDIDAGYKIERSDTTHTRSLLAGVTWRW